MLDAIKKIHSYAKFLKDLCTVKRKLHVKEWAFLTEQINMLIDPYTPVKCKDLGCPTIPINIGNFQISRALLELGANVNLKPYIIYE